MIGLSFNETDASIQEAVDYVTRTLAKKQIITIDETTRGYDGAVDDSGIKRSSFNPLPYLAGESEYLLKGR